MRVGFQAITCRTVRFVFCQFRTSDADGGHTTNFCHVNLTRDYHIATCVPHTKHKSFDTI